MPLSLVSYEEHKLFYRFAAVRRHHLSAKSCPTLREKNSFTTDVLFAGTDSNCLAITIIFSSHWLRQCWWVRQIVAAGFSVHYNAVILDNLLTLQLPSHSPQKTGSELENWRLGFCDYQRSIRFRFFCYSCIRFLVRFVFGSIPISSFKCALHYLGHFFNPFTADPVKALYFAIPV